MFFFKSRPLLHVEGEKVNLRALRKDDFDRIHIWLSDQDLMELAFGTASPACGFQSLLEVYKAEIEHNSDSFLILETKDGTAIGFCSHTVFGFESRARIGIMIGDRAAWNQGFGREAVGLLLKYLFVEKKIRTVELDTSISNVRAQRCFQACGFSVIHKDWCESNDRLWYELDRDRYLAQAEPMQTTSSR